MPEVPNQYRTECTRAMRAADSTREALTGSGNDLDRALTALQTAWVSESSQRREAEVALVDALAQLHRAFDGVTCDIEDVATREPHTVDPDDRAEAWKATFRTNGSSVTPWL